MSFLQNFFNRLKRDGHNLPGKAVEIDLASGYNKHRPKALRSSVCFAPSVNMIFSEDGTVKACCHNKENILGRYPIQNIAEIWNSDAARQFRKKMNRYEFLSGCKACSSDYYAAQFDEMPARHFDNVPQNNVFPTMMEFMLSNTCNLECVMCTGELSSSIRKNRDKLPPLETPYNDLFIKQLQPFIPYLTETRFSSSGEAFLIDMNFKLWEMLIETNRACVIVVQTNGTVLNGRVKDFLNRGNFIIGVSLDSLQKETFESIRLNSSFDRVMENIRYFSDYSKAHNRTFTISTCVMQQNWRELPAFIDFCNNVNAVATFHKVWTPLQYSLHNLPVNELEDIYDELSKYDFVAVNPLQEKNKNHYRYFISVIEKWINEIKNRSTDIVDLSNLSFAELRQHFFSNLKRYIVGQSMLDEDKQLLITLCQDKIDEVLNLGENDESRKASLILLNSTPVSISLPAIKNHTAQKLYEMSQNQLQ